MKRLLMAGACAAAVLSLGACSLAGGKLDIPGTVGALAAAGCKGTLDISGGAQTASGASLGSAHAEDSFHGDCDPARTHPPAAGTVTTGAVVSASPPQ